MKTEEREKYIFEHGVYRNYNSLPERESVKVSACIATKYLTTSCHKNMHVYVYLSFFIHTVYQ